MSDSPIENEPKVATPRPDVPTEKWRSKSRMAAVVATVASFVVAVWKLIPENNQSRYLDFVFPLASITSSAPSTTSCGERESVARRPALSRAVEATARCDFSTAQRELEAAQTAFENRKDREGEASAIVGIVDLQLRSTYRLESVSPALLDVARDADVCPETRLKAQTRIGEILVRRREYQSASDAYERVAQDQKRSPELEVQAYAGLGLIAIAQRDIARAEESLSRARRALRDRAEVRHRAELLTLSGEIEYQHGRFDLAFHEYSEAAALYAKDPCGDSKRTLLLCVLGDLKREKGIGSATANELYEEAERMARELPFAEGRARALVRLAMVATDSKQFDLARSRLEQALGIYRQLHDLSGEAYVHYAWRDMCRAGKDVLCERHQSDDFERVQNQLPFEARLRVP